MFIAKQHLSRRAVLKGLGVTLSLPLLDAMVPAATAMARTAAAKGRVRLVALEMVHGAAGSTNYGAKVNLWSPEAVGAQFDLSPTSLAPLEPFRDYLTIVSNTDCRQAEAFTTPEIGGDHFRAAAVFLTQAHPKQTMGSDVMAGVSLDQVYAKRFGQDTPIPSVQLCVENNDQSGGCEYNYSCVYTDSISWSDANTPMPMIRDPRAAFDQLFGAGATPEDRARRRREDKSILDALTASVSRLKSQVSAPDRARLTNYLDDIREVERRIQKIEQYNSSGEPRQLPSAPIGIPDSYTEHVQIMFDLQALALASEITRVFSFKMSRDVSNRVYPETGVNQGFHNASHHNEREDRIRDFAKINKYHVGLLPYFFDKLKKTADGDSGSLLDNTLIIYGSPMGNPNLHNHKRCALFMAGKAGGALHGGLHLKAPNGTPMANAFLSAMHGMGMDELKSFGDSNGMLDLNTASETSAVGN
jgi:hypothetical protein